MMIKVETSWSVSVQHAPALPVPCPRKACQVFDVTSTAAPGPSVRQLTSGPQTGRDFTRTSPAAVHGKCDRAEAGHMSWRGSKNMLESGTRETRSATNT